MPIGNALLERLPGAVTNPAGLKKRTGYLIDNYPAIEAFSLRKLSTAYTGPAIRVQRADGSQLDIGFVSGALDTATLLTFTGTTSASTGKIKTVYDQSGNGRHLVAAAEANMPLIVAAGVYRASAFFDGGSDIMTHANPAIWNAGSSTLCAVLGGVAYVSAGSATGLLFGETDATKTNGRFLPFGRSNSSNTSQMASNVFNFDGSITAAVSKVGAFDGNPHQDTFIDTGASIELQVDKVSSGVAAYSRAGFTFAPTVTSLGGRIHSGATTYGSFEFYELIAFAGVLPAADLLLVQNNQKAWKGTP